MYDVEFSALKGTTIAKIGGDTSSDVLTFHLEDGRVFRMMHHQDCCENVWLEEVIGDLEDLIGTPVLRAEERIGDDPPLGEDYKPESYTWTFYEIATIKGSVTLRWYGTSNGYYSESVSFEDISEGSSGYRCR